MVRQLKKIKKGRKKREKEPAKLFMYYWTKPTKLHYKRNNMEIPSL